MVGKKLAFICFATFLAMIGVGGMFISSGKTRSLENQVLRMAMPLKKTLAAYDPVTSHMAYDWMLYAATFSPLVEFDSEGQIVSAVAEKFYWEGDKLVFEIRENYKTVDGVVITAKDAENSLKRVILKGRNPHGNLAQILGIKGLKSLDENCPQITSSGNKLVLSPKRKTPFLLSVLTSVDFAIMPTSSIDPSTFAIMDFRNTSGPYFVASFDGEMLLEANRSHWHYSEKIPQKIRIVNDYFNSDNKPHSLSLFESNEIDIIPTHGIVSSSDYQRLYVRKKGQSLHRTMELTLSMLYFTPKGRKLSVRQRTAIRNVLQKAYAQNETLSLPNPTQQFFPQNGHGGLNGQYKRDLEKSRAVMDLDGVHSLTVSVPAALHQSFSSLLKNDAISLHFVNWEDRFFDFNSYRDDTAYPDLILIGQDVSYQEDLSLLSFSIFRNRFPLTEKEGEAWLEKFVFETDDKLRMKMIHDLHFEALVGNPTLIPLFNAPYFAIAQNGWKMNFPKFGAQSPLWRVTRDE